MPAPNSDSVARGSDIAVIGMAGRFPGARDIAQFWRNLRDGVESITDLTDAELTAAGVDPATLRNPNYIKRAAVLEEMEGFDAAFFGFSPRDAAIMDPQHRHFLECAWEALEHAGHVPETFAGAVGVYAGCGMNAYLMQNLLTNRHLLDTVGLFLLRHTGNDKDFLSTRLSYCLNLSGPSVNIQTACSTSLVAIHVACQALLAGECDLALAGGVTIEIPHRRGYIFHEGEILSRDGHCRAFDASSTGAVFGSGVGVVVLRRLQDALEDGDCIHAVVKGSAINNDGRRKVGYLAPSVEGQANVIAEAIAIAGVEPESISYVETHGTGTVVGDPIEMNALTQAFGGASGKKQFCAIGSVKTNIGHLDTAAGVAAFIKTVLSLTHKHLPASLHFQRASPHIDFANSPFYVNTAFTDWPASAGPRRAGVTSLGVGGTNAHVVLEEAPAMASSSEPSGWQLLVLSARTEEALEKATDNAVEFLKQGPHASWADIAYTAQTGRKSFGHRRIAVSRNVEEAAEILERRDAKAVFTHGAGGQDPSIVFLFPGGGTQYPRMGLDLYQGFPGYRQALDACLERLRPHLDVDLKTVMFPPDEGLAAAAAQLERPSLALPALFATEYAVANLWSSLGVKPAAMMGHSMGEYAAACLSGVMSLDDALALVALRGQLFERLPAGSMLAVPLSEEALRQFLPDSLSIAAINAPSLCVVSGPTDAIDATHAALTKRGIDCQRLKISVAAHSAMLDPILDEFAKRISTLKLNPPRIPWVSNVTGKWITASEAQSPRYWTTHLRQTVRFADGLGELLKDPTRVVLEVGPGQTLGSLAKQHPARMPTHSVLASLRHPQERISDVQHLLTTCGRLWLSGQKIDWPALHQQKRRRVALPTYPFEHQRYWIEPGRSVATDAPTSPSLVKSADVSTWFYHPTWKPTAPALAPSASVNLTEHENWLVFVDDRGLGSELVQDLRELRHTVITVRRGAKFKRVRGDGYEINPGDSNDYDALIQALIGASRTPTRIVHLWSTSIDGNARSRLQTLDRAQDYSFYSLIYLAQAVGRHGLTDVIHLSVVSCNMQSINGERVNSPEQALVLGPCRVIPREFTNIRCQSIDVDLSSARGKFRRHFEPKAAQGAARHLLSELRHESLDPVVAYRAGYRWVEHFEQVRLDAPDTPGEYLRPRGVYLITGGLGEIGLVHAEYLASAVQAKLVLTSRTGLPPRSEWDAWCRNHGEQDQTSGKIRRIQALETAGAEVLVSQTDVTDLDAMRQLIAHTRRRFGTLHGVIHAAGTMSDGLIALKSRDNAEAVLAPKVRGTMVLDEVLRRSTLDFIVLFSSTSSILGPTGQADYVAANSFLNGYSRSARRSRGTPVLSINWGIWRDIGMAVNTAQRLGYAVPKQSSSPVDHPLLQACLTDSPQRRVYLAEYCANDLWVLNEHRLRGDAAVMPGTAYLEMAKAAFGNQPVEVRDLSLVAPLHVADERKTQVRTSVAKNQHAHDFTIESRSTSQQTGKEQWQLHGRATVAPLSCSTPPALDLDAIRARCHRRRDTIPAGSALANQHAHLCFGPRWNSLKQVWIGEREAIAELELPDEFDADLERFTAHPAMLDVAIGFALDLVDGRQGSSGFYAPLSYTKARLWAPMRRRVLSYVRCVHPQRHDTPVLDITITDEHGTALLEIEQLVMRLVAEESVLLSKEPGPVSSQESAGLDSHVGPAAEAGDELLQAGLQHGIAVDEGVEAFRRMLSRCSSSELVASSIDLAALIAFVAASARKFAENPTAVSKQSRPTLTKTYVPPKTELEKKIAAVWEEILGIDQVGINDNFFELGGHSLLAVRLFGKIKAIGGKALPLATLFEAPTIEQLARLIGGNEAPVLSSSLVPIQPNGSKPPFFCIHGMGGNVLEYLDLARYLSPDQPFYGIQAKGLDGDRSYRRVEDFAAHYISQIRTIQPDGPYYLGGSSFGGLVGYEMAQQLRAEGQDVALLALFDTFGVDYPKPLPNTTRARQRINYWRLRADNHRSNLRLLGPRDKLAYIGRKLTLLPGREWRAAKRTTAKLDRQVRLLLLPRVLREQFKLTGEDPRGVGRIEVPRAIRAVQIDTGEAANSYRPRPYAGRVTLFRASDQPFGIYPDPTNGWKDLVLGELEIHEVSGHHGAIVREPRVRGLAEKLNACLARAHARKASDVALQGRFEESTPEVARPSELLLMS